MQATQYVVLFIAAAVAGAVNSVAGGGTLITFPALLWTGQTTIIANATSTVALWPGQLSSLWGYRSEMGEGRETMLRLAVPSFIGGLAGSLLLLNTEEKVFKQIVPFLILAATLLFLVQEPLSKWQKRRMEALKAKGGEVKASLAERTELGDPIFSNKSAATKAWAALLGYQLCVAIYGGYFGAGIGILQLAAFGLMGFTNIHRMNGFKNINGLVINGIAVALFVIYRLVDWKLALLMASGAILGGYAGAGIAKKVGQKNVRKIIIAIGFSLTIRLYFA